MRLLAVVAGLVIAASACSSSGAEAETAAGEQPTPEPSELATTEPVPSPTATVTPEPTATPTPVPSATPTPTPTPQPTATPTPSATPSPTPTPTPVDTTPIVIQGDGWAITEADVARMAAFVEDVHELEFTAPVLVESNDDIGANVVPDLDLFPDDEYRLIAALGLIDPGVDQQTLNQFRRDRIRGVCCSDRDGRLAVIVEPNETKLETEVILVHELVHALHRQHPGLQGGPGQSGGFELPSPWIAAIESVPQYVTFRYLDTLTEAERATFESELPIVTPEMVAAIGEVPAAMLNFAYFTAVPLADAAVAAQGIDGLSALLQRPPTTTEQVLYPDRWLAGEDRVSQAAPPLPEGAQFVDEGRLGVAMLGFLLDDVADAEERRAVLAEWTGDRWSMYRSVATGDRDCIVAVVEMDSPEAAARLADLLGDALDQDLAADDARRIRFDTCAVNAEA